MNVSSMCPWINYIQKWKSQEKSTLQNFKEGRTQCVSLKFI